MDRVRTGLTGLGLVFLFTLVASVAFAPSRGVEQPKAPGEPLAQLGVAPGSDKNGTARDALPAPEPAPFDDRPISSAPHLLIEPGEHPPVEI